MKVLFRRNRAAASEGCGLLQLNAKVGRPQLLHYAAM